MLYKIFADLIVVMHFVWILFMLVGFMLTLCGFFYKRFFDWWSFRVLHLCGIAYVGLLALLRQYCPLTILEYTLRAECNPELRYPGSFIVHYIEKLVYPDVNPLVILIPTIFIAVFTIVVFIIKPPTKIRRIFKWREKLKHVIFLVERKRY
ncbi:MAG: DUF2784 domain-containing protein [Candidatus Omnitrophica bacterium]|nr:DUF2784 domain-containing protein [Candidatus Omnitrophota bacterium]MBU1133459.1 DUF2784 domain-containing protein [Candidatus Omnitrophota bacterium]MBU1366850.1 DUF2784 domain-containing protein [Candidatus Omnitrophota bacterium]MBU1524183.1 DUF2784 domain-containing protein [Candidatus Omnitrophota bacterium]MBU1810489.1 DUF2784 domain-containing protein [Candidatus Omnitrophota bacterium]